MKRSAKANDDGKRPLPALKASTYRVVAETAGLSFKIEHVSVNVGQELTLNLGLAPSGVTATVNVVSGEEALTNTGSAAMGANVNPREVQGLPLNGRQLSQLYLQAPGSVNSGSGTLAIYASQVGRSRQNEIRYDGIEGTAIIDPGPGNLNGEVPTPFRLQFSLENVQEFRVDSTTIPRSSARAPAGKSASSRNQAATIFMARLSSTSATMRWMRRTS